MSKWQNKPSAPVPLLKTPRQKEMDEWRAQVKQFIAAVKDWLQRMEAQER